MKIYVINAFTLNNAGGNPAGVVIPRNNLSDSEMQGIATSLGFSETVFISKKGSNYRFRYFMPTEEIDLCGHATIAAVYLLQNLGFIERGIHSIVTNVGELEVILNQDGMITMQQDYPVFYGGIDDKEVYQSLGLSLREKPLNESIEIVSTGVKDLLIPVINSKCLDSIEPDFDLISKLSKKYDVCGYHVYAQVDSDFDYEVRNFAPLYGINEEVATGTSNCALGSLVFRNNKKSSLKILQGKLMDPSMILTKVQSTDNKIEKVFVSGYASIVSTKDIDF